MTDTNETHDPSLRSWVPGADAADADFPVQNLPFGVFRRAGSDEPLRGGVAIGDHVLDLSRAVQAGVFEGLAADAARAASGATLNPLMAMGAPAWSALRLALSRGLRRGAVAQAALSACLLERAGVACALPARIGDYTDFYTGIHHATAVGRLFRPDNPLLPNYKWVPIGYHGRSSSIGVSGQRLRRPLGQLKGAADEPALGPSQRLDYELELGFFVGPGNPLGEPVPIAQAPEHLFGVVLLNDWSARDVQAWEYQPLGPFLAKSFATTISPWVITMEALAPFRAPFARAPGEPQPLPYLDSPTDRAQGALDITLEAWLQTAAMRAAGQPAVRLTRGGSREAAYWTAAQLLAHHTVNGCNLQPGDLLGSGTLSGPAPEQAGSLLELSGGGRQPITLPGGETRSFLQDGDTLTLRGYCERAGAARIGLGEVSAMVEPALA